MVCKILPASFVAHLLVSFKLHFRPKQPVGSDSDGTCDAATMIPPLPLGKSVVEVFADFLRYLFICARTFIQEAHVDGVGLWSSVQARTHFILPHPNGWEGEQQSQMRQGAILAGLIAATPEGRERVHFVTEGEASLHYCIINGLTTEAMKVRPGFHSSDR